MADQIPMTAVLIIFYLTFASQIFLLSIYYPGMIAKRIRYVLKNYPPDKYPKLYPSGYTVGAAGKGAQKMTLFRLYNGAVAVTGIIVLTAMISTGYRPDAMGGDEIFVMLYFLLQIIPSIVMAFREFGNYHQMHQAFAVKRRTAELRPRRLFDFVSPAYVVAAIALFAGWAAFYINSAGDIANWGVENYATIGGISAMNIAYIIMIRAFLSGKKLDPYQAYSDQLKTIESTIKTCVISSILVSLFLFLTQVADQYGLEVFDPPLTSFYVQLCVVMALGLVFRLIKLEEIDFEVYRENAQAT